MRVSKETPPLLISCLTPMQTARRGQEIKRSGVVHFGQEGHSCLLISCSTPDANNPTKKIKLG
jgi:hypothetical protein